MCNERGFSLIELLITVAIVAILAAIALPSYESYVLRTNRSEARSLLVEVAALQERFRYNNPGYAVTLTALGLPAAPLSETQKYQLSMVANANSFTLTAAPRLNQLKDLECANLTLTNTGVKGKSGTATAAECWK
jgi:type IV pilus assembly protein PilE